MPDTGSTMNTSAVVTTPMTIWKRWAPTGVWCRLSLVRLAGSSLSTPPA
jgi:hypothetical protein